MILAAGLGTRLRPLTDHTPKALVEVAGTPMLGHVARHLVRHGATRLVVNVHHHADQIQDYLDAQDGFGVDLFVSEEPERRLETGGGLLHARRHFRGDRPIVIHNADILTDLDVEALYRAHQASGALATLAVRPAETDRYLVFSRGGVLCGYAYEGDEKIVVEEAERPLRRFDFCGVQVVSPRIFDLITETGVFSIINVYLRLAKAGHEVRIFEIETARWLDIGTHERLAEAEAVLAGERE